jgi:hypothetical protein
MKIAFIPALAQNGLLAGRPDLSLRPPRYLSIMHAMAAN